MSALGDVDIMLLDRIRHQIEDLAGLGKSRELTQKDFEFLLFYVQEKTGQSLSMTTIKRIWKSDFQRLPHRSTLDMFCHLAFSKDWHQLKKEHLESDLASLPARSEQNQERRMNGRRTHHYLIAALVFAIVATLVVWLTVGHSGIGDTSTVKFSARATTAERIPNSVIFTYDVSHLTAQRYLIQQSWDPARQVEISPSNKTQTDIYYEPGYHYAKLIANEEVIREIPVHIIFGDWYVRFRFEGSELLRVPDSSLVRTGHFGLKHDYLSRLRDKLNNRFQLGYMLSKKFEFSADHCAWNASVRFDASTRAECPAINLLIKGDKDYAWITIGNTGCESNFAVKVGDAQANGKQTDLSALSINAFEWQHVAGTITNGVMKISINHDKAFEIPYQKQLGELKEFDLFFNGVADVNSLRISSADDNRLTAENH